MQIDPLHVQYDRNGITGEGFHRVKFQWTDTAGSNPTHTMLAIVFDYQEWKADHDKFRNPAVAIIDLADTLGRPYGTVGYPDEGEYNAYRGDHFADAVYQAIADADVNWDGRQIAASNA